MTEMKMLIVDDVSIMRKVIKGILIDHCKVDPENIIEAADGAEAIMMYKECTPDIVFLDITMPDISGKDVINELRKIDPEAIIVMCSGSGDKASVIECIRAGAKDYIRKPITHERLVKALDKAEGFVLVKRLLSGEEIFED